MRDLGSLQAVLLKIKVFWDVTPSRRPISRRHIPKELNLQFKDTL